MILVSIESFISHVVCSGMLLWWGYNVAEMSLQLYKSFTKIIGSISSNILKYFSVHYTLLEIISYVGLVLLLVSTVISSCLD